MIPRWLLPILVISLGHAAAAQSSPPRVPARLVLAVGDDLQLTPAQTTRLESLEKAQEAAVSKSAAAYLRAEADLLDAMRGDDLLLRRAALERRAKVGIDAEIARLQGEKDARAVLLPDQRAKLLALPRPEVPPTIADVYPWEWLVAPPPLSRVAINPVVDSGIVRLKVTPNYAEIFIDSVKVGTGFKQLALPVGQHLARFQAPGCGAPVEQQLVVGKNQLVILPPVAIAGCEPELEH
jgi:Spy/CpxP family protein refolding chaperone